MAKEVYADDATEAEGHGGFFGLGEKNDAFAPYFIGQSYLKALTGPDDYLAIHNVTFEPGCRNNWHVHHASKGGGQVLICVEGEGWYQEEGKPARSLKPGDVVRSRQTSSTGTAPRPAAGSVTSRSASPVRT